MVYVRDVFTTAMGLMDELSDCGCACHADTVDYARRTPMVMNLLLGELGLALGGCRCRAFRSRVECLDDVLGGVDDAFALGAMPYGLAANLLVDENPAAANFYQQRYELLLARYLAGARGEGGDTQDLYGGIEYGCFARW